MRRDAPSADAKRPLTPGVETDIVVFLFRTALIVVLAVSSNLSHMNVQTPPAMRIALMMAALYTVFVALGWLTLGLRPLLLQRPLGIIVDLLFITVILMSIIPPSGSQRAEVFGNYYVTLYQVYYLVIIVAAVWYRLTGALLTAIAAIVLWSYVWAVTNPPSIWPPTLSLHLVWTSGAPFLLLMAFVSGYLMTAMKRESQRLAQLHHELAVARHLQDTMLPAELPTIPGFDVGLAFQPARLIGGDLYDVMALGASRFLICVGDMAGKSIYGLVHLSLVHSYVRGAARQGMEPAQIAEHVNDHAYEALQPDSYASLFVGILDASTGVLTFANCGHLPPLLVRSTSAQDTEAGRRVERLSTGGIVIGGMPNARYTQAQVVLEEGDILVLYTDGVSEARNRHREMFGEQRIWLAAAEAHSDAQAIADRILQASQRFSTYRGVDDVTILAFRRVAGAEDEDLSRPAPAE